MTKNTSYHYSIIIPHKNTPRLLERCLYSIPTWDEIQIIIIDDNSNSESVDFSHFPGNGRKNTEVLFTKEGKGAGYARNIGLSHARAYPAPFPSLVNRTSVFFLPFPGK